MVLFLAALAIGYWIDGAIGSAIGGCVILMLIVLSELSTPKDQRENAHETQMRTNQTYRDAHWRLPLEPGRQPAEEHQESQ